MVSSVLLHGFAVILGCLSWVLAEYWIHRRLGHETRVANPFLTEHREHHRVKFYFAPTWKKIAVAMVVLTATSAGLSLLVSRSLALTYSTAFALQYLGYEFFHRRIHTHPPRTQLGMALRKHHLAHHFGYTQKNFGVSSRIFDRIFGTLMVPEVVRVPPRMATDWLVSEAGSLRPEFDAHFRLG